MHMYVRTSTHVHFSFSGKSAGPPWLRRSEGSPLGKISWETVYYMYIHMWVEEVIREKKRKKKVPRYIEFSDSLGDSEVVRVLGNAVHNTYHFKRQQAVQSMHIHSQSLSASRRNRCYARRKSWVKKFARPVNASIRCSQLASRP